MKKRLIFDFETLSAVDLKSAGGFKYSLDPSTRPTCFAFKIYGEDRIYFLDFYQINTPWKTLSGKFKTLWEKLINEKYEFSGHNVFFDMAVYKNILVKRYKWPDIPFNQFRCTAAKAAACALPRNLEGAGSAMNLTVQKDKRGYVAMMLTCRPTKHWKAWDKKGRIGEEPKKFLEPADAPDVFETLYEYCKIDVLAEEKLDLSLPDLIPQELEIWFLNQKLNWRGLLIDIPTVKKIIQIMETESKIKLKELDNLTMGLVTKPGARNSILEFLKLEGIELPDIRAQTVKDALSNKEIKGDAKRLLEIRQALSKTSNKKYNSFVSRANDDNRVRDILMYHGASTGRDTGTGIQPHNFPRGLMEVDKRRPYQMVENIKELDTEMLKLLYGENLSILFSQVLRNMIIPSKGKELFVADFSKIEVAVLWWISENAPGLRILNKGLDPYKYMASANTGLSYDEISDESEHRQLGKAQVLGCGFGMGWKKFQQTAWDIYRLKLDEAQSRKAVTSYRETNSAVPELWKNFETAAILAVKSKSKTKAGKCEFEFYNKFLWVKLPSGRRLAYREPQISWRMREYEVEEENELTGEKITVMKTSGPYETLEFWAPNSKTKKWNLERTWGGSLTENIIQATARDLMMPAMLRLEETGYQALLMVHDEGICEREIGEGDVSEFVKILCAPPAWAKGLPIDAKGWSGERYRK